MKQWKIPKNPPPWENKPFPIITLSGLFILINSIYLFILFSLKKSGSIAYLTNNEGTILYFLLFLSSLLLLSLYSLYWEVRNTLYVYWCYWQANILNQWVKSKQKRIYLTYSSVLVNDNSLLSNFHNDNITQENKENENGLIKIENDNITGDERIVYILKELIKKIENPTKNKNEKINIIINTKIEQNIYIKEKIDSEIKSNFSRYEIIFSVNKDYNEQWELIASKKVTTFIFSLNYYASNTQDEEEIASLIVLSSTMTENAIHLFQPMPYSISNQNEYIDGITFIQQQKNSDIQSFNFIGFDTESINAITLALRSQKEYQNPENQNIQIYSFNEFFSDYQKLSIYHFIALINQSKHRNRSQYIFYSLDNKIFFQTIGLNISNKSNYHSEIPKSPLPIGTLLFSAFIFISIIVKNIFYEVIYDDNQIILCSLSFIFSILVISLIKKAYILFYWKSFFIKTLKKKWN